MNFIHVLYGTRLWLDLERFAGWGVRGVAIVMMTKEQQNRCQKEEAR